MSYDVSMDNGAEPFFSDTLPTLDRDGFAGTAVLTDQGYARCGNYTSNVSGMWTKCLTAASTALGRYRDLWGADARRRIADHPPANYYREHLSELKARLSLRDLEGQRGEDLILLLRAAVGWGLEHLAELHEDDPDNGWGDADGAVTYLWDIQRMCEQNPTARLEISS